MNDAALRTFIAIAEEGSLVRASERLNVTQSTVTARLQTLEAELGQPLFTRGKSGARLTAAGARFRRYAEAMTSLWGQARQDVGLPEGVTGVCNIASHPDLWNGFGAPAAEAIRKAGCAVAAWPCDARELDGWLGSGLADFALAHQPSGREGVSNRSLGAEPILLYSTDANAPLRFDPKYVFVDNGEAFGRAHHAAYADADTARLSFGSAHWALAHLEANGGSAYLPRSVAAASRRVLFEVRDAPAFSRAVFLVTLDRVAATWPWLEKVAEALTMEGLQAAPR
ncbi:MAG: LysR family transcriptional regulator [Pseudomonadota bacterium]